MKMHTYVNFAGTCAAAFRYYEQHLGGRLLMLMTHGDAPAPSRLGPEWAHAVLHARMAIADTVLAGADIPAAEPMRSAYLTLNVESDAEAERVFAALSDGGLVLTGMTETFFATRFGQVRDRFGINWVVLHERPTAGATDDPAA